MPCQLHQRGRQQHFLVQAQLWRQRSSLLGLAATHLTGNDVFPARDKQVAQYLALRPQHLAVQRHADAVYYSADAVYGSGGASGGVSGRGCRRAAHSALLLLLLHTNVGSFTDRKRTSSSTVGWQRVLLLLRAQYEGG